MKFMIITDTTIKKYHVYEVEAPTKAAALNKAEQTFNNYMASDMNKDVGDFKFIESSEDEYSGGDTVAYTLEEGWCQRCAHRALIDHTVENFDCSCECHDEEANEYEEMWKEACDKDD